MDIALFLTGWLVVACALILAIARAIPPSANDPVIDFTHGEAN
ncbi:hypothetical protein [uncultured Novosphingobium sp.]